MPVLCGGDSLSPLFGLGHCVYLQSRMEQFHSNSTLPFQVTFIKSEGKYTTNIKHAFFFKRDSGSWGEGSELGMWIKE